MAIGLALGIVLIVLGSAWVSGLARGVVPARRERQSALVR